MTQNHTHKEDDQCISFLVNERQKLTETVRILVEALELVESLVRTGNFIGSEDLQQMQAALTLAKGE